MDGRTETKGDEWREGDSRGERERGGRRREEGRRTDTRLTSEECARHSRAAALVAPVHTKPRPSSLYPAHATARGRGKGEGISLI